MKSIPAAGIAFHLPALIKKPFVMGVLCLFAAILVFTIILMDRSPGVLRPLGLSLRTGLNLTVILYFLVLYITFRIRGWGGRLLSLVVTLAMFAFSLVGLWAIGQTQSTIFTGIVPLFDASDYYADALRLLAGEDFSVFSARRPLFPGLLAVVLWLSHHHLTVALGVFTLITAIACYAAAMEIQRTHGAELAVFTLVVLFLFYRHHAGSVMSENLGLPLGALGFALLWRGTAQRSMTVVTIGVFLLTLGLNARAGTFFMLPLLLLWGAWVFRTSTEKLSWKFMAAGAAAVVTGFLVNMLLVRLLATPSGVPFANFSYSLYGLASGGKPWIYVFESHPELNLLQEPFQSREVYRLAFEQIRAEPLLLIKGALFNWSMLFSNSWYGAYAFVSGENAAVRLAAQWGMFLLCALGIFRWFRQPGDPFTSLVAVAAIGVFISVPFLPPTDAYRMRPYATSIIVFGLLPGMGMQFALERLRLRFIHKPEAAPASFDLTTLLTVPLLAAIIAGPVVVKSLGELPEFRQAGCSPGMELVSIRFDPGVHFNILRQSEPGLDWLPNFRQGRYRRNAHSLPDPALIGWAESISPRNSVFSTLDFQTMKKVLLVAPTASLPAPHTLWQVCGVWEPEQVLKPYRIFYVSAEAAGP